MPNMSYCRFENTYEDLQDCFNALDDEEDLSEREQRYRDRLIKLCHQISENFYGEEFDEKLAEEMSNPF